MYKNILNNDVKYRIHNLDNCDSVMNQLSTASDGCGKIYEKEFTQMCELVNNKYIDYNKNTEIPDIYEGSILYFFKGKTPFLCFDTEGFSGMKKRESKSEEFTAILSNMNLFHCRSKVMYRYSALLTLRVFQS